MHTVPTVAFRSSEEHFERLQKERDDAIRHASELKEQLEAMDDAARLLVRVVTMPQREEDRLPLPLAAPPRDDEARDEESRRPAVCIVEEEDRKFDDMQKKWKFEHTAFPSLFNACKMLRESRRLLSLEADHTLDEMRVANDRTAEVETKLRRANRALRKLCSENQDLREQNTKLKEKVDELSHQQRKQLYEVYAMLAHEEAMSSRDSSFDSDDNSSFSSAASSPASSVVDNGSATLRFKDASPPLGDLIARWMNKPDQTRNVYHITFAKSSEIGMKLRAMPVNPPQEDGPRKGAANPFSSRINLVGLQVDVGKLLRRPPDAFIVCGFRDVDTCSHQRPTIGARLVAMDKTSVELGQWTLKEVCQRIRSKRGPITLSFRNDPVTVVQVKYLNGALAPKTQKSAQKQVGTPTA